MLTIYNTFNLAFLPELLNSNQNLIHVPFRKEELEKYKSEQNKPAVPDSDVLKMLQNTKITENQAPGGGSFSKLQDSLNNEGTLFLSNNAYFVI